MLFDGWLLHCGKSDCCGSRELLNARVIAKILDSIQNSRLRSVVIHTEIINLTVQ